MTTDKGIRRMTVQKSTILNHLKGTKSHPSAEMVYEDVKKSLPNISLGTVYRNLNQMSEDGLIHRLEVNGEYRFDADLDYHVHCICKECNKIIDIHDEDITLSALNGFSCPKFKADDVTILYSGICKSCLKKR
jgi:Fur family transcriptional regulator, peroxide stress response regulator